MSTWVVDLGYIKSSGLLSPKKFIPEITSLLKEKGELIIRGTREELERLKFWGLLEFDEIEEGEYHIPVMPGEVLEYLSPEPGQVIVDATAGTGGHTSLIARRVTPGGVVIAVEKDPSTFETLKERVKGLNVIPVLGDYRELNSIVKKLGFREVDACLFDLGISSYLLERTGRGFSFKRDEPLDMRFNADEGLPASHYLNTLREEELFFIFKTLGEEKYSRRIARKIVELRAQKPLERTKDLNRAIDEAVPLPVKSRAKRRIYQAIRIFVNDELRGIVEGLIKATDVLKVGGKLVVISYHSLEDRIVKHFSKLEGLKPLTKKPIKPSEEEVKENPRARSAKLRAIVKVGDINEEAARNIPVPPHPPSRYGDYK